MFGWNKNSKFSYFGWNTDQGGPSLGEVIALNHYNRVIAAGGVLPCGVAALASVLDGICTALGITSEAQFQATVPEFLDPHYSGYLAGSGSGVTLGQAAQRIFNIAGASGDVNQTTAGSQPLLLTFDGVNKYWFNPFVSNNFCSASNITIPTNNGLELDLKMDLTSGNLSESTFGCWFSHDTGGGNRPLFVGLGNSDTVRIFWNNFANTATSTASISRPFNGWLRVKLESISGNMVVTFSTSSDGVTYNQLGDQITVTGASNTVATTTASVFTNSNNGANPSSGRFFRAIYKDANGVIRADFNPNTYNAATSQTQWTSTTGEVWTINTDNAQNGYKGVLVHKTIVQGNGNINTFANLSLNAITIYNARNIFGTNNIAHDADSSTLYLEKTGTSAVMFNGASLSSAGFLERLTNIIITQFNGASSVIRVNNNAEVSGNAGLTPIGANFRILRAGSFSGAQILSTFIATSLVDDATTRTAIYNLVKSMNNL